MPLLTHYFVVLTHLGPSRHVEAHTYLQYGRSENEHFFIFHISQGNVVYIVPTSSNHSLHNRIPYEVVSEKKYNLWGAAANFLLMHIFEYHYNVGFIGRH